MMEELRYPDLDVEQFWKDNEVALRDNCFCQNYFEVFLAIVECKNVSKAAERLFLSQSTVSHRLKMLENDIGCSLFERAQGQRECVLTAKGEAFLPLAYRWMELYKDTKRFSQTDIDQVFTIGAVTSVNQCIMYQFYKKLLEEELPYRLDVKTYGNEALYANVASGTVDMALAVEHIRNKAVDTKRFFDERLVLVCCPGRYTSSVIHPEELDPANEIALGWDSREIQLWHEQWFAPNAGSYLTINDPTFVHYFFGDAVWAIVPVSVGLFLQNRHGLEIHELHQAPPKRICYLLKPRQMRPERERYVAYVEERLKQYFKGLDWAECRFE